MTEDRKELVTEVEIKDSEVVKKNEVSGTVAVNQEQPKPKEEGCCQPKPNHEDHKKEEPKKEPRRFKKELTIDHDLYEFEMQKALKQGVQAGYTQALNQMVKYLNDKKPLKEVAAGDLHPMWEFVLKALNRADEWKEYEISKTQKEQDEVK